MGTYTPFIMSWRQTSRYHPVNTVERNLQKERYTTMKITINLARTISEYGVTLEIEAPQNLIEQLQKGDGSALVDVLNEHFEATDYEQFAEFETDISSAEALRITRVNDEEGNEIASYIPMEVNHLFLGDHFYDALLGKENTLNNFAKIVARETLTDEETARQQLVAMAKRILETLEPKQ